MNADADRQDLAAEYVLGTLDAAERAEAEALIAADAAFAALVGDWEYKLGELSAMVAPVSPPAELWAAIQARLAEGAGSAVAVSPSEPGPVFGAATAAAVAADAAPYPSGEAVPVETTAEPLSVEATEPPSVDEVPAAEAEDSKAAEAEAVEPEPAATSETLPPAAEAEPEISEPSAVAAEVTPEAVGPAPEAAPYESAEPSAAQFEHAEPTTAESESAAAAQTAEPEAAAPELLAIDAAMRQTVERIVAESEAAAPERAEAGPAEPESAAAEAPAAPMAERDDAAEAAAVMSERAAADENVAPAVGLAEREREGSETASVIDLTRRMRRWRGAATIFGALAAGLAAVIVTAALAPAYLPESLRPPPEVRTVEVPREVVRTVQAPAPGRFIAVLQTSASAPAFIITVDVAQRNLTVRRVAAETQTDHSYELWLVSNRLQAPRSLGLIGASEFTQPPTLAAYDPETISDATFAVSLEPEGGSPTGQPTGPVLFSGKLVETVPPGAAMPTP